MASAADKPQASDFQYQDVYVVGHSLGSVIVYDVLNRMISISGDLNFFDPPEEGAGKRIGAKKKR